MEEARARGSAEGVLLGTGVLTLEGEIPVEYLTPGDRVVTRSGARALRRIRATRRAGAVVVRMTPGAIAPGAPDQDVLLGTDQKLRLADWRAKAMFGAREVMVEVGRMVDGQLIRHERLAEARIFTLEFDAEETIYADGVEIHCPARQPAEACQRPA